MGPKGRQSRRVEPKAKNEQTSFDSSDELEARRYPTVNHLQSISRGFADEVGRHYCNPETGAATGSPAEHTARSSTNSTASQLDQSEAAAKLLACNVMLDGEFYCSGIVAVEEARNTFLGLVTVGHAFIRPSQLAITYSSRNNDNFPIVAAKYRCVEFSGSGFECSYFLAPNEDKPIQQPLTPKDFDFQVPQTWTSGGADVAFVVPRLEGSLARLTAALTTASQRGDGWKQDCLDNAAVAIRGDIRRVAVHCASSGNNNNNTDDGFTIHDFGFDGVCGSPVVVKSKVIGLVITRVSARAGMDRLRRFAVRAEEDKDAIVRVTFKDSDSLYSGVESFSQCSVSDLRAGILPDSPPMTRPEPQATQRQATQRQATQSQVNITAAPATEMGQVLAALKELKQGQEDLKKELKQDVKELKQGLANLRTDLVHSVRFMGDEVEGGHCRAVSGMFLHAIAALIGEPLLFIGSDSSSLDRTVFPLAGEEFKGLRAHISGFRRIRRF